MTWGYQAAKHISRQPEAATDEAEVQKQVEYS